MIKFEETSGRVRKFCEQYYTVDAQGYVIRNGKKVDATTLINDMVAKHQLSEDELVAMLSVEQ